MQVIVTGRAAEKSPFITKYENLKKEHLEPDLLTSAAAQSHTSASYTIWRRVMEEPLTPT